jgi:hypothetical protein
MSEPETFVARWSRLKREAGRTPEEQGPEPPAPDQPPAAADEADNADNAGKGEPPEPAFDAASLPPIESITAGTDVRAFLQAGVPAELTRAALRRVWTTDPAIRDFIGIAENQWDFTDPGGVPGFGPLEATDDVGKLVARVMGDLCETADHIAEADREPAASGVRRNTAPADRGRSAAAIQEAGIAGESAGPALPAAEAADQQKRVDVAARDEPGPAKRGTPPNRRGHGSALPQ